MDRRGYRGRGHGYRGGAGATRSSSASCGGAAATERGENGRKDRQQQPKDAATLLDWFKWKQQDWDKEKLVYEFTQTGNRENWDAMIEVAADALSHDDATALAQNGRNLFALILDTLTKVRENVSSGPLFVALASPQGKMALVYLVSSISVEVDDYGSSMTRRQVLQTLHQVLSVLLVIFRKKADSQTSFGPVFTQVKQRRKVIHEAMSKPEVLVDVSLAETALLAGTTDLIEQLSAIQNAAVQLARERDKAREAQAAGQAAQRDRKAYHLKRGVPVLDDPEHDADYLKMSVMPSPDELLDERVIALPENLVPTVNSFEHQSAIAAASAAAASDMLDRGSEENSSLLRLRSVRADVRLVPISESPVVVPAYRSLDHLLNTHFQLVRKDAIGALQRGIVTFRRRLKDAGTGPDFLPTHAALDKAVKLTITERGDARIHVYTDVKVVETKVAGAELAYDVRFTVPGKTKVDWSCTSRLMNGSLLCLSPDGAFSPTSMVLATVAKAVQVPDTKKPDWVPLVSLSIDAGSVRRFDPNLTYTMLESPTYFEAYRHVLTSLQMLPKHGGIPFCDVLLGKSKQVPPPSYIKTSLHHHVLPSPEHEEAETEDYKAPDDDPPSVILGDLSASVQDKIGWDMTTVFPRFASSTGSRFWDPKDGSRVLPDFIQSPPLDRSQRQAISLALSRGLSLIQGPPGTGKTFVGVLIARLLLANANLREPKPILFLCQTNHALDQVLEHVYRYETNMVRIGGRSLSPTMQALSLASKRLDIRQPCPNDVYSARTSQGIAIAGMKTAAVQKALIPPSSIAALVSTDGSTATPDISLPPFNNAVLARLRTLLGPIAAADANPVDLILRENVDATLYKEWMQKSAPKKPEESGPSLADDFKTFDALHARAKLLVLARYSPSVVKHASKHQLVDVWCRKGQLSQFRTDGGNGSTVNASWTAPEGPTTLDTPDEYEMEGGLDDIVRWRGLEDDHMFDAVDDFVANNRSKDYAGVAVEGAAMRDVDSSYLSELMDLAKLNTMERQLLFQPWQSSAAFSAFQRKQMALVWRRLLVADATISSSFYSELFERAKTVLTQSNAANDAKMLASAKVVGMTTTGAAKHSALLRALEHEVVIVEEAAEVLEAHILAALTPNVKHMILIGDHLQLRPIVNDYALEKHHALDVSLFERLVNSGIPTVTLTTQRRMHPFISSLIRPVIYKHLDDAPSTLEHAAVRGIGERVFFITHTVPEDGKKQAFGSLADNGDRTNVDDGGEMSKCNSHEAEYIIRLIRHLLTNGYSASQIVVLSMYKGQLTLLKSLARASTTTGQIDVDEVKDVRVTTTDNFQGEESDVVILSLVRSNLDRGVGSIGFVATFNRVNVALSRARHGLYVIGNMELMRSKSPLWDQIISVVESRKQFGKALPLVCPLHSDSRTVLAEKSQDFDRSPNGGCMRPCDEILDCGHKCSLLCHPVPHSQINCMEACQQPRPPECSHTCPKRCYEVCGPCLVKVTLIRSKCGHSVSVDCADRDVNARSCPAVCNVRLPCNHFCTHPCGTNGHENAHVCKSLCKRLRSTCDHPCPKLCSDICPPCEIVVTVVRPCGHSIEAKCFAQDQVMATSCTAVCMKVLPCGHTCRKKCGEPCSVYCSEKIKKDVPACDRSKKHSKQVECGASLPDLPCREPCGAMLDCGHVCRAPCNQCTSDLDGTSRCHEPCASRCKRIMQCGHKCRVAHLCSSPCPPCTSDCAVACSHRRGCGRTCAEPCRPCLQECDYKCSHFKCSLPCSHIVKHVTCSGLEGPCMEACSMVLSCGHPCTGYCGDLCVPLCAACEPGAMDSTATNYLWAALDSIDACPPGATLNQCLIRPENDRRIQLRCDHVYPAGLFGQYVAAFSTTKQQICCPTCHVALNGVVRFAPFLNMQRVSHEESRLQTLMDSIRSEVEKNMANGLADLAAKSIRAFISQRMDDPAYQLLAFLYLLLGRILVQSEGARSAYDPLHFAQNHATDPLLKAEAMFRITCVHLGGDALVARENAKRASERTIRQLLPSLDDAFCAIYPDLAGLRNMLHDRLLSIEAQSAARQQAELQAQAKGRQRKREQDESIEALAAVRQREAAEAAFSRSADLASLKWSNALQQEEDDMRTAKTITEQGGSALHVSASLGRLDDVILLLKEGADPAERDHKGDTPLHLACRARRLDVVRVLLDVSPWVAVNQNGKTPIDDGLRIGTSKDGEPVLSDDDTSVYVQDVIQKVLEDDEKAEISRRWACQRTLGAQCPALDKLMNLIGLRRVKEEALLLYDQVSIDLRRPIDARTTTTQAMNFIFLGNPGTGKTTVSRLLAQMLQELGLRESTSTFVETSGQELLDKGAAEFSKTLTAAPPGVLFIDEINQLDPINNQVGRSITNSILLAAENSRSRLSIIVAGYASEVNEKWLASNDGLRSRFPYIVHFDDFTENELRDIFIDIVRTKGWRIQPTAKPLGVPDEQPFVDIPMVAARRLARGASLRGFANARSARIMVEASMRRADQRLKKTLQVGGVRGSDLSSHALTTLTRPDILGRPINEQESSIMKELFAMTGLADVKKNVSALVQLCSDNFAREERGERPFDMSLHRVFLGNPGTGKTSIAKIYGKILKELGYLSDGEVIVKGASAFMGQYVGSTGAAVNRILNEARGKVLVIDEAYAFCTNRGDGGMGGTLNFGTEAIDTLVERIQPGGYEDMAVILCGYESEMRTMFRDMNPGLESRFQLSKAFIFADYTKDELVDIMLFQAQKRDMSVSKELAVKAVSEVLEKLRRRPNFGNARAVSTLLDTAIERQSARFRADPGQQAGRYFTDIDFFEPPKGMGAAYDTLRGLLNTEHIIGRFQRLEKSIRVLKANGRSDTSSLLSNWSFVGPPGTGKTTVGRALAELYHGLGLLASPLCIECKATELIGAYIGQTAPRVRKKMDDALGGVLFIDEAYGLDSTRSTFAQDAQEALLANMTDPKYQGKLVVVLAGYESHIQALMMGNPGMYRRFPERLEFSPWDATACTNLVQHCLSREGIDLPIGLTSSVMTGFEDLQRREGWGNAGDAVTVARKIQEASHQRCDEQGNVTGPLLLEDVSTAFSDLKKRRLNGTDVSRERYSQLPAATVAQTTAESPVQCASEGPGESAPAALGPAVATSPDPEQQADVTENDSPPTTQAALSSDPDIVASLDDAVARLGYDAYRVRDIAASAVFPLELLELVARIAGSSVSRVHPLLVAQCPAVLQNATVAIWQQEEEARLKQQEEERIARAEENERARLRMLADAERAKRVGAYICGVCGRQGCPVRPIWREGVISGPLYNGDNGPAVTAPPPE